MNANEQIIKSELERRNFTVLRNGWPDFLCLRKIEFTHREPAMGVMAVEVKTTGDSVSQEQRAVHSVLRSVRIPVHVVNPKVNLDGPRLRTLHVLSPWEQELLSRRVKGLEEQISQLRQELDNLQSVADGVAYFAETTDPLLLPMEPDLARAALEGK